MDGDRFGEHLSLNVSVLVVRSYKPSLYIRHRMKHKVSRMLLVFEGWNNLYTDGLVTLRTSVCCLNNGKLFYQ